MRRKCHLSSSIVAGLLLSLVTSKAEVICGKVRPLKQVRCVCGRLIDPSGGPVSGATVKVAKDGIDLATAKTAADGTFSFGELKSGGYELIARTDGFVPFRSPIVVKNPAKKCGRGLVIVLVLFYPDNCGSYVMKP
jgi:hypothetical protein